MSLVRQVVPRLRHAVSCGIRSLCTPSGLPQPDYDTEAEGAAECKQDVSPVNEEFLDLCTRLDKLLKIKKPTKPTLPAAQQQAQSKNADQNPGAAPLSGINMEDVEEMRREELEIRKKHFQSPLSQRLQDIAHGPPQAEEYKPRSQFHHHVPQSRRQDLPDDVDCTNEGNEFQARKGKYNHGLPGIGKKGPKVYQDRSWNSPDVQGEVLFGIFPCLVALQEARRQVHQVFVQQQLLQRLDAVSPAIRDIVTTAEDMGVQIVPMPRNTMTELSQSRPHQGVCMDVSPMSYSDITPSQLVTVPGDSNQIWVVLDKVQDPMNFGAILRTCYYMGVDRVITSASHSCALSPVVSKASAGALEVIPVHSLTTITTFLQLARNHGWDVVGTSTEVPSSSAADAVSITPLHQLNITSNTIVLLGNEGGGLDESMLATCNHLVSIPPGRVLNRNIDSLNVSVATGVLLHHIISSARPRP